MSSILVVDDDENLRDGVRRILHQAGYEVREASDGLQGMRSVEQTPVDVILLDIFMPGKEGLETIRELRCAHSAIRIIAMSGGGAKGSFDMLKLAQMLGARRTLAKPFSREQLLDAIQGELGQA
ncbi:MAG: response regulator [Nitrospirae bacterium]|nr:response regulator [Nitrospirota bacterium]